MFKSNSKIQWCSTLTYTPIQLRQQPQVVLVRPTDKLCDFLLQTTKLPVTTDEVSELCAIINFIRLTHSTVPVCSTKSFRAGHCLHTKISKLSFAVTHSASISNQPCATQSCISPMRRFLLDTLHIVNDTLTHCKWLHVWQYTSSHNCAQTWKQSTLRTESVIWWK